MHDLSLKLYQVKEYTHKLVPAERHRDWQKQNPYVFKCRPLNNANCFGWDLITSKDISVSWNGDTSMHDVTVDTCHGLAITNFGHGTFTFVTGYTFHTSEKWALYITPIPNEANEIFYPYSALVETDNLKYPLFVTVKLNRPGTFFINKGTKICRIVPVLIEPVLKCVPEISCEPDEFVEYRSWQAKERKKFQQSEEFQRVKNARPYRSEKLGWQKFYDKISNFTIFKMKDVDYYK